MALVRPLTPGEVASFAPLHIQVLPWEQIESLLLWAVKRELLTLRIDYKSRTINQRASMVKVPSWEGQSPPSQPLHVAIFGSHLLYPLGRRHRATHHALRG